MPELLYESISEEIIKQIRLGKLKENDKLSERSLADKYSVSRTVVRDALKVLNEKGYVYIKTGKGHFIKHPDENDFNKKLSSIVENSTIPFPQILEARSIIETAMVDLVIKNVEDKDILELTNLCIAMQSLTGNTAMYNDLDKHFHIRLMRCCKNEMLVFFIKTLNANTDRNSFMWDEESRKNAYEEHLKMVEALKKKDGTMLSEAFAAHIACIRERTNLNDL